MKDWQLLAGVCFAAAFGWALLSAADARTVERQPGTITEVFVREVAVDQLPIETPIVDALVDLDEFERQSDCLWVFLQAAAVELTVEVVWAAGVWTDAQGGACLVIGEDDE